MDEVIDAMSDATAAKRAATPTGLQANVTPANTIAASCDTSAASPDTTAISPFEHRAPRTD